MTQLITFSLTVSTEEAMYCRYVGKKHVSFIWKYTSLLLKICTHVLYSGLYGMVNVSVWAEQLLALPLNR